MSHRTKEAVTGTTTDAYEVAFQIVALDRGIGGVQIRNTGGASLDYQIQRCAHPAGEPEDWQSVPDHDGVAVAAAGSVFVELVLYAPFLRVRVKSTGAGVPTNYRAGGAAQ